MSAQVHAIMLLLCPLLTIVTLLRSERRKLTSGGMILALVIPLLVVFMPATMRHMCYEGQPFTQWLIPLLCLWVVLLGVGPAVRRRWLAAALIVAMYGLTWHYLDFVHGPEWTGNPDWDRLYRRAAEQQRQHFMTSVLEEAADDEKMEFPAGWVRDLPFASRVANELVGTTQRGEVRWAWHSRLTRLYRRVVVPQDFWYPGGTLAEAAERIEIRDRPKGPWGTNTSRVPCRHERSNWPRHPRARSRC